MDRSEAPGHATVICTLGMHRSGTSVVSRVLNLLGVPLGREERLSGTGEDNAKGYWELRSLVELDDEILGRLGGRWDAPPVFPPRWPADPRLRDLRDKARRLLAEEFAAAPLWGWKDPRACLTLPFWQDLVGPMRYVMCIRNPCAVVASLGRRNDMRSEQAERLWLTHVQASLAHTSGHPRLFVFYEDLIDDWPRELRRLAAFVGVPERADDARVRQAVSEFVERGMCHHRMSMEDLARDQRIAFPTKGLYLAARLHAGGRSARPEEPLDLEATGPGVERTLDLLGARALESWTQAAALAAERDSALQAVQAIQASCAWRLVAFSRGLMGGLLPAGTRRRRLFDAILRRIVSRLPAPRAPRSLVDPRPA